MLRHFAQGPRRFGLFPMRVHPRLVWEFYATLSGRMAPILESGPLPLCTEPTLWIFPPEFSHGWTGQKRAAQVVVLHYGYVPTILDQRARGRGYLEIPLDEEGVATVQKIAAELKPHFERPNLLSPVIYERALCDLTLLACQEKNVGELPTMRNLDLHKVEMAIAWYHQHLQERPTINEAAKAAHVSVSHLRRLFWRYRKESPQSAFMRVRLELAVQRMTQTYDRLDVIAQECGFGSISDLCRRFKSAYGTSAGQWRRKWTPTYYERDQIKFHDARTIKKGN